MENFENTWWLPSVSEPAFIDPSTDVVHIPVVALIKDLAVQDLSAEPTPPPPAPPERNLDKINLTPLEPLETLEIQSNVDVRDKPYHFHKHTHKEIVNALDANDKGLTRYCKNLKTVRFVHGRPKEIFKKKTANCGLQKDWQRLKPALRQYFEEKYAQNVIHTVPKLQFRDYGV
jgi:hypothetical protein